MWDLTIYTKENCPQCDATKRFLDKAGVEYDTYEISPIVAFWAKQNNLLQAPVVLFAQDDTQYEAIGGFNPYKLAQFVEKLEAQEDVYWK